MPLFAGFDEDDRGGQRRGRIFSFDVTGGRYEEKLYHAIGSGSLFAKSALKKRHDAAASQAAAIRTAVDALYDAADDDSATGGPDTVRGIYPIVAISTAAGAALVDDDEVAAVAADIIEQRRERPGG